MHRKMHMARRGCGGRSLPSSDLSRRSDPGTVVCRRKSAFSEGGWMDSNLNEWLNLVFRWIHVLAGVMWIGHLWFFNFVNTQLAKTYDPDSRKKVVPELMPRALYWFRWGAAFTWITGVLLLLLVYYHGGLLLGTGSWGLMTFIMLAIVFFGVFIYDQLVNTVLKDLQTLFIAGLVIVFIVLALMDWVAGWSFRGYAI